MKNWVKRHDWQLRLTMGQAHVLGHHNHYCADSGSKWRLQRNMVESDTGFIFAGRENCVSSFGSQVVLVTHIS